MNATATMSKPEITEAAKERKKAAKRLSLRDQIAQNQAKHAKKNGKKETVAEEGKRRFDEYKKSKLAGLKKGKSEPKPKAEKKPAGGKHEAIANGGEVVVNEQIGLHFRIAKGETHPPVQGDLVLVKVGHEQVVLLVKHTQVCLNGELLVQAFTGLFQNLDEKPAYQILMANKGELVRVFWRDEE